jgi:hypothetical protein
LSNPPEARTLIYWINDGGTMNKGWQKTEGIDWQASYDWEWGTLGAFNVGMAGTYYLSQKTQRVAGDIINDLNQNAGRRMYSFTRTVVDDYSNRTARDVFASSVSLGRQIASGKPESH